MTVSSVLGGRRIALVHDWLNQIGGAEGVLETLVGLFPDAPVFTSMYAPDLMPASYREWDVRTSFMQHLPGVTRHHQAYLPLYPLAFRSFDLRGFDLILSNKSGFCHGVRSSGTAKHVCYCLAPTRFLWQYEAYRQREALGSVVDVGIRPILSMLRRWDYSAAQRVDHFVAISTEIRSRIATYYHRDSDVIFPPVEVAEYVPSSDTPGDYYLAGGRLIPYKRTDLAIRACSELGERLLVYGDGRDRRALEQIAGPSVTFLGRVPRDELVRLYQGARAFIFPGFEDFGITPVECQAAGRPVIAFAGGGALDTVIPGRTGELFHEQSVASLTEVLRAFSAADYDPQECRRNAERFSRERFEREIVAYLSKVI